MSATQTAATQTTDMDPKNAAPAFKFAVKKHVTLPLLKIVPEKALYVKFEESIVKAKPQAGGRAPAADSAAAKKEPPELAHVIDLTTGEHCQIIIGTVLGAELRETYPDNSYVGKSFEIVQHKVQGKQYATYGVTEIEVEQPKAEEKTEAPAKGSAKK
jgi:hypothetical protein